MESKPRPLSAFRLGGSFMADVEGWQESGLRMDDDLLGTLNLRLSTEGGLPPPSVVD